MLLRKPLAIFLIVIVPLLAGCTAAAIPRVVSTQTPGAAAPADAAPAEAPTAQGEAPAAQAESALAEAALAEATPAETAPAETAPAEAAPAETAPADAPATQAEGEPVRGGTVVVGSTREPDVLNPLMTSTAIADALSTLIVEGLVEVDDQGNYIPVLAAGLPEISNDGLTVVYTIKPGITFSNGDPLTCDDVQYTWNAILSGKAQISRTGYTDIDSIYCPDDLTVVLNFADVYAPYLDLFSAVLPRAAGNPAQIDAWEYNRRPIGTGPWLLTAWQPGDSLEFSPNPGFREPGKPYLDKLIVKILPSRSEGLRLLEAGEIQALWGVGETDFTALGVLRGQGITYASARTGENELLLLNLADPSVDAPAEAAANPHPILGDLRVRQAIQYAIDKQDLVDRLHFGNVKAGTTVIPHGVFACPQEPSEFSVEKANALLDEAGWTVGADGIREKDGKKLELKITAAAGNTLREQIELVLVEMLRAVGIRLVIENVPSSELSAAWEEGGMRKHGQFDILLFSAGPTLDPGRYLHSNYHTASIPTAQNQGSGSNFSRYANGEVDAWIDGAASTADAARRKELFCQVAVQINQDLPRIFLYERPLLTAYKEKIRNFKVSPGPADFTFQSENWWLAP